MEEKFPDVRVSIDLSCRTQTVWNTKEKMSINWTSFKVKPTRILTISLINVMKSLYSEYIKNNYNSVRKIVAFLNEQITQMQCISKFVSTPGHQRVQVHGGALARESGDPGFIPSSASDLCVTLGSRFYTVPKCHTFKSRDIVVIAL